VNAEKIGKALGGRKIGDDWTARCPAHDDGTPSFSIRQADDGKVLVRCHAGCKQRDVIKALRARGLWEAASRLYKSLPRSNLDRHITPIEIEPDAMKRSRTSLEIWWESQQTETALVETYLRSRGLAIPIPPSIRFHAGLRHSSGSIWPAMVGLVTRGHDGKPLAIHRTYLARDGIGKAPVAPQKMMLGPCRGGAVRLAAPGEMLMVAEGIETALTAIQATGHPAWAALSTSGLRVLDLPGSVREVIVLADGDDPGEKAACDAALRWSREGRRVRIARPPRGADFNDLLLGGAA
jgi:putative DNA primase/helicase